MGPWPGSAPVRPAAWGQRGDASRPGAPDRWLLGKRGPGGPCKHPEVTNAVSSSLFGHFSPSQRINLLLSHRPKSQQRRPSAGSRAHPAACPAQPLPLRNPFLGNPDTQPPARPTRAPSGARKKTSVLPAARGDPPERALRPRPGPRVLHPHSSRQKAGAPDAAKATS